MTKIRPIQGEKYVGCLLQQILTHNLLTAPKQLKLLYLSHFFTFCI